MIETRDMYEYRSEAGELREYRAVLTLPPDGPVSLSPYHFVRVVCLTDVGTKAEQKGHAE